MKTNLFLAAAVAAALVFTSLSDPFFTELTRKLDQYWSSAPAKIYLQPDRTWYKPGEDIWFKVWLREGHAFSTFSKNQTLIVDLQDPRGRLLESRVLRMTGGSAPGDFKLLDDAPGGIYHLRAYLPGDDQEEVFVREITVQQTVLPRLRLKLDFERKAFGPGDEVIARLDAHTLDNRPLTDQPIEFTLMLNGKSVLTQSTRTDATGRAWPRFTLPATIDRPDGLLNIQVLYRGKNESISRAVPIVLNRLDLQFLPEGGDLVDGLPGHVAFKALDEFGKPADVAGAVFDDRGQEVATFTSYHNGMGGFPFAPRAGVTYTVCLTQPAGNNQVFKLPPALSSGVKLAVKEHTKRYVDLEIATTGHHVTAYLAGIAGGQLQYREKVKVTSKPRALRVPVSNWPMGIATFTLFDEEGIARAERLVFLHPDRRLHVKITSDREQYLPRQEVNLTLKVTDHRGRPVAGDFALAVTDDNLITFADDKQGRLPAHWLLQSELRGRIEDPDFYFDPDEPKAALALDYLMLTNGWRRMVWKRSAPGNDPKGEEPVIMPAPVAVVNEALKMELPPLSVEDPNVMFNDQTVFVEDEVESSLDFRIPSPPACPPPPPPPPLHLEEIFRVVEEMPRFSDYECENLATLAEKKACADRKLQKYLYQNLRYPYIALKQGVEGTVVVTFVVDRNGYIADAEVVRGIDNYCDQEALRVITMINENGLKWTPGKQRGRPVKVRLHQPIKFSLNLKPDEEPVYEVEPYYGPVYRARQFYSPNYQELMEVMPDASADYRTTLFWDPDVRTGADGIARVSFYTSDAVTTFRAVVEGLGDEGGVAHGEHRFFTQPLLEVDARLPALALTGDTLVLPLRLVNNSLTEQCGSMTLDLPEGLRLLSPLPDRVCLPAGGYRNFSLPVVAERPRESGTVRVDFKSKGLSGSWQTALRVASRGFPVEQVYSGMDQISRFTLDIADPIDGSLEAELTIYVNPLQDILTGMERMLKQPSGCFEQVSSSNYPNLLVIDLLRRTGETNLEVESTARRLLEDGYNRLIAYESPGGGFHWWGHDPGHEALTAYGIMEFVDMQRVFAVDQALIDRAAGWLLSRRDGKGGWLQSGDHLHSWQGAAGVRGAYIVWALCEAGMGARLSREIDQVYAVAMEGRDPYILALLANALQAAGDSRAGMALEALLATRQPEGYWDGKTTSIIGSGKEELRIETTALSALGLMKAGRAGEELAEAIRFLKLSRTPYGFGNTQSTVLAMKALAEYATFFRGLSDGGEVVISIDGCEVARQDYAPGDNKVVLNNLADHLTAGTYQVEVRFGEGSKPLPHDLQLRYTMRTPPNSPSCPLRLQTSLVTDQTTAGNTVRLRSLVENTSSDILPTPMALIGIPAGLTPQPWQLKELVEKGVVDYYEQQDGYIFFYFERLEAKAMKTINLDLRADLPGRYEAPASSAYLYYASTDRSWSAPGRIVVE